MPELPEVETVRRGLEPVLTGARLSRVRINRPDLRFPFPDRFAERLDFFSFTTCVVDPASRHPRLGYVTDHLPAEALHAGEVDVYLCGPPPMVDAVRNHFSAVALTPANFYYEKFTPNAPASAPQDLAA